jgi:hypothetical protein
VKTFSHLELILGVMLGLFLLFLALRGFVAPAEAARGFGIPAVESADLFHLRVKADRDLSSAVAIFVLIALRERRALGAFVGVATVQPLCDLALSIADAPGHAGYALAVPVVRRYIAWSLPHFCCGTGLPREGEPASALGADESRVREFGGFS